MNQSKIAVITPVAEQISKLLNQPFNLHIFSFNGEKPIITDHAVYGTYQNPLFSKRDETGSIKKGNTLVRKENLYFLDGGTFKQFYPEGAYKTIEGIVISVHSNDIFFDQYVGFILAELIGTIPVEVVHRVEFMFLPQLSYLAKNLRFN